MACSWFHCWQLEQHDFTFPFRFLGFLGHLRLICEGYSEVLLFLQVEVRGHEVKQLLGQKFGLEGEQNGKGVSDESLHFLNHSICDLHNFLNVMYQSSSTSMQKSFLKPKGADNEDASEQRAKYRCRPSALCCSSSSYQRRDALPDSAVKARIPPSRPGGHVTLNWWGDALSKKYIIHIK